jgi:predicted N-acyltransferase
MTVHIATLSNINEIDSAQWNALAGSAYPFLRYEFLSALENSGAVGSKSGWEALHQLIYREDKLIGLLPLYRKRHSWGEYVFDWAWAQAYQQHGLEYYPKLVCAIPYTPSQGPRFIVDKNESLDELWPLLEKHLLEFTRQHHYSSLHLLFTESIFNTTLKTSQQLLPRLGVQYHWLNRHAIDESQKPYRDFPDFLSEFNSRKRRSLTKERKRVDTQNVTLKRLRGAEITEDIWETFYQCYQLTYLKRSGHSGYLNREFFLSLAAQMSENILLIAAQRDNAIIAAALCFIGEDTLYGRYWGCLEEIDGLHFEACYYQGIEFCIEQQLRRFDPGAQGEHKISRGFRPVFTYSWHYLTDVRFQHAITDFLAREQQHILLYRREAESLLPFRQTE